MSGLMNGLRSEIKSWRDECQHFPLCDAKELNVLGAVALPSGPDEHMPWHYHEHDTVCIALTPIVGVNETLEKQQVVTLEKGEVLLYNLRGMARYVHRFRATCDHAISFLGVEVLADPLSIEARRATLKNAILLQPDASFASVSRIVVPPQGEFQLARNQGYTPFRTVVVSLSQNGLKRISIKNAASCDIVRKIRHDVLVEACVITEKSAGCEVNQSEACVVVNTTDGLWVGAVVDVWVKREE